VLQQVVLVLLTKVLRVEQVVLQAVFILAEAEAEQMQPAELVIRQLVEAQEPQELQFQ
jgi:hypothetical protein